MINGRGGKDGKPDRLKARRFLRAKARERTVKLDGLQEGKPMGGERGEAYEAMDRFGLSQRRALILAEIARDRQPVHHRATRGNRLHGGDRIGWAMNEPRSGSHEAAARCFAMQD